VSFSLYYIRLANYLKVFNEKCKKMQKNAPKIPIYKEMEEITS